MFGKINFFGTLFLALLLSSCFDGKKEYEKTEVANNVVTTFRALPRSVKSPIDNPTSETKVQLGKLLFFDPILSGNKDVACATCHHPDNAMPNF